MSIPALAGSHPREAHWSEQVAPAPAGSDSAQTLVDPADRSILVLGSPRSGTTWLAKILDSNPDVIYRHEPDEVRAPVASNDPRQQLRVWINERCPRVSAKPPLFRKSYQPLPLALARAGIAQVLKGAARLQRDQRWIEGIGVPDFVALRRRPELRVVLKLVNWNASDVLRAIPGCRCLFILRHPCGQIASTLVGVEQGRFSGGGALNPAEEAVGIGAAAARGIDAAAFRALSRATRLAWVWRGFNEAAIAELRDLPNARVVLFEELCDQPQTVAQNLFDFAGLGWHAQTVDFLGRSTRHEGLSDYYAVFRSSGAVARQWRSTMPLADQEAVRSVVLDSPLAHHWDDLRV